MEPEDDEDDNCTLLSIAKADKGVVSGSEVALELSAEFSKFLEKEEAQTSESSMTHSVIRKEMALFDASSKRPENLQKLFKALKTIKPTSVESERAFSGLGWFVSKLRTRLQDKSIEAMSFLKVFLKKN